MELIEHAHGVQTTQLTSLRTDTEEFLRRQTAANEQANAQSAQLRQDVVAELEKAQAKFTDFRDQVASFEASNTETASPRNPLGAKGIGESGTIGSTPAVHNAVCDAVAHLGITHIDMPCSPERVWTALQSAS